MLNRESLEAALPLAELMDRANLVVRPRDGSPLAELVAATRSDTKFALPVEGKVGEVMPSIFDIEYIANTPNPATGVCEHDVALDALVELGVQGAQGYQQVIKNGVIPAVLELQANVAKAMQDMPVSALLGMEVKIYDLPLPIKSPAIEGLISKWLPTPLASPALRMRCPDVTMEELCDLMKTGAAGFDSEVTKWVATKGESWFLQLWEDIFQTKNDRFDKFNDAVGDRDEGLDRSLAIFLIARKLVDDPVEGTSMSLPALKSLASEYRNQAAGRIERAMDDWANVKKRDILVKRTDDKCVTVNEVVYRPWIMAGGSNELLFGSLAKRTGFITTQQIDAAAEDLKAAWMRLAASTKATERTQRFLQLKEMLYSEFRKSVNEYKGDADGADASAYEREKVLGLFRTELAKFNANNVDDLYAVCLKLICRSRFYKIECEGFIQTMMKVEQENPNISAREASTIAIIEYISTWVAGQFLVVPAAGR